MNRFTIFAILFWISFVNHAKADRFIYRGDTVYIESKNLLNSYPQFNRIKSKLPECYRVEWNIHGDALILNAIYRCATPKSPHLQKIDLKTIFDNDKLANPNWINDTLWMPLGKAVKYYRNFPLYKGETKLMVKAGKVTSSTQFNYKNVNAVEYDSKVLYAKINWSRLPYLATKNIRVGYQVTIDENGKVIAMKPDFKSVYPVYNDEAEKAIRATTFSTYYRHNQFINRNGMHIFFELDEQTRKQHVK